MRNLFSVVALTLMQTLTVMGQGPAYIPGDLLVMMKPGEDPQRVARDLGQVDGAATAFSVVREVSAPMRAWLLRFQPGSVPQDVMLRAVIRHPGVQLAQNNHVVSERAVPNDAQYGQQWHHQIIDSEIAWDISTGGVTTGTARWLMSW